MGFIKGFLMFFNVIGPCTFVFWVVFNLGGLVPLVDGNTLWDFLEKATETVSVLSTVSVCKTVGLACCRMPYVREPADAVSVLEDNLQREFYGQHVAAHIVTTAIHGHLNDRSSSKALVLSFHGWAGSGKTYLSEHIMKALYKEGADSPFVKFYMASYHFPDPDPSKVLEYQEMLRREVSSTVKRCNRALFIFDEVDKTPPGVFDALVPFIHHTGEYFEGVNYKKSIFIFISNTGANEISMITLKAWEDGRRREDLDFQDFESVLSMRAFSKKDSGLYKSRLIDKILVDFYVPFLPMERKHVISCARREAERLEHHLDLEKIAEGLVYWPADKKLYSQTGCKKIEGLVKYYVAESKMGSSCDDEEREGKTEL